MSPHDPDRAARLLAEQLADLVRYRQIAEAQRAVVRMGDAGLLDAFAREADGIVADLRTREGQLEALRAAAAPLDPPVRVLAEQVEKERQSALASARLLAADMQAATAWVSRQLREATAEYNTVVAGYARREDPAASLVLDRTA